MSAVRPMTSQHENPVPVAWEEPEFDIPDPTQLYKIFYTYCIIGNNLMVLKLTAGAGLHSLQLAKVVETVL